MNSLVFQDFQEAVEHVKAFKLEGRPRGSFLNNREHAALSFLTEWNTFNSCAQSTLTVKYSSLESSNQPERYSQMWAAVLYLESSPLELKCSGSITKGGRNLRTGNLNCGPAALYLKFDSDNIFDIVKDSIPPKFCDNGKEVVVENFQHPKLKKLWNHHISCKKSAFLRDNACLLIHAKSIGDSESVQLVEDRVKAGLSMFKG